MTQAEEIIIYVTGLGAIIGGLYYVWHIRQSGTIICVEPYIALSSADNESETIGVKVINESNHAITLSEMGVLFSNTEQRMVLPIPLSQDNKPLPRRIEPHDSFSGTFEPSLYKKEPNMVFATHVYAQLSNGNVYKKEIHFNPAKKRTEVKL